MKLSKLIKDKFNSVSSYIRLTTKYIGGVCGLIIYSFPAYIFEKKDKKTIQKNFMSQVYFTGNLALQLVSFVALALGAVTIIEVFTQLSKLGAIDFIGQILNIVIIRELGPLITAFIVISRSSSAIATEISTMVVSNQIDAMEMIGIDPLTFIIFPRIAGVTVALIILTIYFNAVGLIGGFLVSYITIGMSFDIFFNMIMNSISFADIVSSILKSISFGLFISAIPIYIGFQAKSSTYIPVSATKTVMDCILVTIFLDIIFTIVVYI